jgi:hypothetical protein
MQQKRNGSISLQIIGALVDHRLCLSIFTETPNWDQNSGD